MSERNAAPRALRQVAVRALGLDDWAGEVAIRRAYRRIARRCHPDRRPVDPACPERFRVAAEAYEILTRFRPDAHYQLARSMGEDFAGNGHPADAPEGSYARWWWEQFASLFV